MKVALKMFLVPVQTKPLWEQLQLTFYCTWHFLLLAC